MLNVARGVAWRSIHNTLVNPAILVPSIIFPLFFLIAFAGGLSRISDVPNFHYPPGYTSFQFVFVFLQSAAFGGVFTGFAVARDFDSGFARRLLLSAPRRSGIIAGYALGALVRWALTGTVVTIAALIAGMNVDGSGIQLFGLLGLGIAMNFVAALWAVGLAMFLRTEQAGAVIQMPVFVLLFLAPVYVPVPLLTGWIHDVATSTRSPRCSRPAAACSPGPRSGCRSPSPLWPRRGVPGRVRAAGAGLGGARRLICPSGCSAPHGELVPPDPGARPQRGRCRLGVGAIGRDQPRDRGGLVATSSACGPATLPATPAPGQAAAPVRRRRRPWPPPWRRSRWC